MSTGPTRTAPDDQEPQVRKLHADGESIADLVGGFGVSRATVCRALGGDAGDGDPTAGGW